MRNPLLSSFTGLLLAKEDHPIFTSDLTEYILALRNHFTCYEKLWSGELFKVLKHVNDCGTQICLFLNDDVYIDNVEILRTEVKRATAEFFLGFSMFLGVCHVYCSHKKEKAYDELYRKHIY